MTASSGRCSRTSSSRALHIAVAGGHVFKRSRHKVNAWTGKRSRVLWQRRRQYKASGAKDKAWQSEGMGGQECLGGRSKTRSECHPWDITLRASRKSAWKDDRRKETDYILQPDIKLTFKTVFNVSPSPPIFPMLGPMRKAIEITSCRNGVAKTTLLDGGRRGLELKKES